MRLFAGAAFLTVMLIACASPHDRAVRLADEIDRKYWGEWETVIKMATEAIRIEPNCAWPYAQRGNAHAALGHYTDAMADLDTAIRLRPDLDAAYADRAHVYLMLGRLDEAERDLGRALRGMPNNIKTLLAMAEVQCLKNHIDTACRLIRRAISNGFNDLKYIEDNKNFEAFTYSDCYEGLIRKR